MNCRTATPHRAGFGLMMGSLLAFSVAVVCSPGVAAAMETNREALLDVLRLALREETGFIRNHAAEALVEQGCGTEVAAAYQGPTKDLPPIVRVGVWRVLARCAAAEVRVECVAQLRRVMLTPGEPDRVHSAESLAKLGLAQPDDLEAIERLAGELSEAHSCHALWLAILSGSVTAEARLAEKLNSRDDVTRFVAAYIIARLPKVSRETVRRLIVAAEREGETTSRGYLYASAMLRCDDAATAAKFKTLLIERLKHGSEGERYEAALAIGASGNADDMALLAPLLNQPGDVRIGAAQGSLRLLARIDRNR